VVFAGEVINCPGHSLNDAYLVDYVDKPLAWVTPPYPARRPASYSMADDKLHMLSKRSSSGLTVKPRPPKLLL